VRRAVTGGEGGSGGGAGGVQTDGAGVGMARASGPEVPSPRAAMEIARMCCVVLGLFEGDGVRNIILCV